MATEDFDQRIRDAFEQHEPEVKGDWKRMQAALIGAAGGTTAAVVRARWVGGAAGAAAVAAAVSGWLFWKTPATGEAEGQAQAAVPTTTEVLHAEEAFATEQAGGAARTRTEVVIPTQRRSESVGRQSASQSDAGDAEAPRGAAAAAGALISSSVKEACAGTEVTFSLEGEWAKGSILWNFGDGSFSNEVAPVHVFANEGTYDITISMRSPNDGAIRTRTVEDMIVIRPKPDARMAWRLEPVAAGSRVRVALENLTPQASSVTWMQGAQTVGAEALVLQGAGTYPVTLVASNTFGCQDAHTDVVRLGDRSALDAPSTFSPDGDGKRDTFMPEGLKRGDFVLVVRDLEGNVVFETSDAKRPWDGRLQNGAKAPFGAMYQWCAVREVQAGKPEFFSDRVRIER